MTSNKDLRHKQIRQQEMANVVDAEVHFESICRCPVRSRHNPSIVDHYIDLGTEELSRMACATLRTLERESRSTWKNFITVDGSIMWISLMTDWILSSDRPRTKN